LSSRTAWHLVVLAHGLDDLGVLPPFLDHLHECLRRVLQVRVHRGHGVALGGSQAGQQGRLMPEIPAQPHQSDAVVLGVDLLDDPGGPVGASVVDEDQFK